MINLLKLTKKMLEVNFTDIIDPGRSDPVFIISVRSVGQSWRDSDDLYYSNDVKHWLKDDKMYTEKSSMYIASYLKDLSDDYAPITSGSGQNNYHKCTKLYCIDKHLLLKQLVSQYLIDDLFNALFWMI